VTSAQPKTIGDLRAAGHKHETVKQEMRRNLISRLRSGEPLLAGIVGYDETVLPQLANAIISGHDVILLGERLRRAQWSAVAIAAAGVVVLTFEAGHVPWIALTLAASFGLYGLVKKIVGVGAVEGLVVETSVLTPVAEQLRAQGHGTLVVLSSIAGERARRSNYVYGSSKAALDAFAQGLSDRLVDSGVRVMIVRPGFVHTKMTAGETPPPLATTPGVVADSVIEGLAAGRPIVWVPSMLRPVMSVLRHLPRPVFRRLPI